VRKFGLMALAPKRFRELEPLTPKVQAKFSFDLIRETERPEGQPRRRVGMITGCVADFVFSHVNRDTVDVLLENGCEVFTPRGQACCGSLHGHNGEWEMAKRLARSNIDAFAPEKLDAIIINAAGCGSHLKHYVPLLHDDPRYRARAEEWDRKARDIHEFLVEIDFKKPAAPASCCANNGPGKVTYHEACHLCHGQKITQQPRQILRAIPGLELVELNESTWCCGSAGVYNITQPEMSGKLLKRKLGHIDRTAAETVVTSNPGCTIQLETGIAASAHPGRPVVHPISLLAQAYRRARL
jgi:glycolate oxidase iron-sulfur subunit